MTQTRIARRVPCALNAGERRYSGIVLNLSQGGLFVQTAALDLLLRLVRDVPGSFEHLRDLRA